MMRALDYLQANAERLHIDPDRIAIAGDSAGAQIAAQLAALITTPGYAERVGLTPAITARQLRGVVLACGPYDLGLAGQVSTPAGRRLIKAIMWAYSGNATSSTTRSSQPGRSPTRSRPPSRRR